MWGSDSENKEETNNEGRGLQAAFARRQAGKGGWGQLLEVTD
jgi:hypothetical protein